MKILITGTTGQVGYELCRSLACFGQLLTPQRQELDLANAEAVARYLANHKPDIIVNPAAWTAVDAAEQQTEACWQLNAALPAQLAEYAAATNAYLIHYSTDYVYPGTGDTPWQETDQPAPLSQYGKSKLAGDSAVLASGANAIIFRTSWVYAARGNNFMKTMLRLGQNRSELSVVADQFGAPTPARLIADVTALAVQRLVLKQAVTNGVYHLASSGYTNWQQFACKIFELATAAGVALAVNPHSVKAIGTADYPTPAARPANSRLALTKTEQTFGIQLPHWASQLAVTLEDYLPQVTKV